MSSTLPRRPAGTTARTCSSLTAMPRPLMSGTSGPRISCECRRRLVKMGPGHTALIVTPREEYTTAIWRVSPTTPCLAATYAAPPPVAARQHLRERALGAEEDAGQVDVDHAAPEGLVHLVDVEIAVEDPGIVDHDLEGPERADGHRHGPVDLDALARIALKRLRAPARRGNEPGRLLGRGPVEVARRDGGSARGQCERDTAPDPRPRSRHHRHPVLQGH